MGTVALYDGFAFDRETMASMNELQARRAPSAEAAEVWRQFSEDHAGRAAEWRNDALTMAGRVTAAEGGTRQ
jgi:hypothetical protein